MTDPRRGYYRTDRDTYYVSGRGFVYALSEHPWELARELPVEARPININGGASTLIGAGGDIEAYEATNLRGGLEWVPGEPVTWAKLFASWAHNYRHFGGNACADCSARVAPADSKSPESL